MAEKNKYDEQRKALIAALLQQRMQQLAQNGGVINNAVNRLNQGNTLRGNIGNLGKTLSNSDNALISNLGDKLYTGTGQKYVDNLVSKGTETLKNGLSDIGSKLLSSTGSASSLGSGTTNALGSAIGAETVGTLGSSGALTGAISSAAPMAGTAGASAASTGALAAGLTNPITAGIAAAAMIGSSLLSSKKQKDEQAMKLAQQAAQQGQNTALNAKNTAMQNLAQNQQNNNTSGIQTLPAENSDVINNLYNQYMQAQSQTPQNNTSSGITDIVNNSLGAVNNIAGGFTGGAAPITEANPVTDYQNYLRDNGYADDVINGVPQGLNSGYSDIDNWIKQYNQGTGRNNPINIPQTDEEITLAREGRFNVPSETSPEIQTEPQTMPEVQPETKNKELTPSQKSVIADLMSGYKENFTTPYKNENLIKDPSKSKANRIGEVLGSAARMISSPLGQGLIAGGLSAIANKNWGKGLEYGANWAQKAAMNRAASDYLQSRGVNYNPGIFGNASSSDVSAVSKDIREEEALNEAKKQNTAKNKQEEQKIANDIFKIKQTQANEDRNYDFKLKEFDYKQYQDNIQNDLERQKMNIDAMYKSGMINNQQKNLMLKQAEFEFNKKYKNASLAIDKQRADSYDYSVHNGKSNNKSSGKPQDNPDWNTDLADYYYAINHPEKNYDIQHMTEYYFSKYGVNLMDYMGKKKNKNEEEEVEEQINSFGK